MHIDRLAKLLESQGVTVLHCDESPIKKDAIFNVRSLNLKRYFGLLISADKVHIHSSVGVFRFFHLVCAKLFFKQSVVTIHSWRGGFISTVVWGFLLNIFCRDIIFVSDEVSRKFKFPSFGRVVFPAFIPPCDSTQLLPSPVLRFIGKIKSENKKLAVSNAFRLVDFGGEDLYGLDLCIKAFENKELSLLSALIFVVSDPSANTEKIERYLGYIKEKKLEGNILLYLGALNFYSLLLLSDISIRATNTDGDAISVRESIFLKKPCIASDVVSRPELAILFKNRSSESLVDKIKETLDRNFDNFFSEVDCEDKISDFYNNLYFKG